MNKYNPRNQAANETYEEWLEYLSDYHRSWKRLAPKAHPLSRTAFVRYAMAALKELEREQVPEFAVIFAKFKTRANIKHKLEFGAKCTANLNLDCESIRDALVWSFANVTTTLFRSETIAIENRFYDTLIDLIAGHMNMSHYAWYKERTSFIKKTGFNPYHY